MNKDHKCFPPSSADKKKTWTCSECKLTWNYQQGLYFMPDPTVKPTWNSEPLIKKKTRETHERLLDKRKRNHT